VGLGVRKEIHPATRLAALLHLVRRRPGHILVVQVANTEVMQVVAGEALVVRMVLVRLVAVILAAIAAGLAAVRPMEVLPGAPQVILLLALLVEKLLIIQLVVQEGLLSIVLMVLRDHMEVVVVVVIQQIQV